MDNEFFEKENNNNIRRRVIYAVMILAAFILQNTDGLFPRPWGLTAFLTVPLVVCISMFEREIWGMFFGLFAGILVDAFSSQSISFHSIALTVTGFLSGILITKLMRNNLKSAIILGVIFVFTYLTVFFIIFYLDLSGERVEFVYTNMYLTSGLYTVFFIPVEYFAVRAVFKKYKSEQ